jgi:hypothetical protein
MKHLTDIELEEMVRMVDPDNEHLLQCEHCKGRLAEIRALKSQLQSAFTPVRASEELAGKIRKQLSSRMSKAHSSLHSSLRRLGWTASAAAAILLVITIGMLTLRPSAAEAARAELFDIHISNVAGNHEFHTTSDPAELAEYFKDKLGFTPSLPEPGKGMALRGCCVRHFKDQVVGSYVVDTPEGVMSIVVVTDSAESMGMVVTKLDNCRSFYKGDFAQSNMVAIRMGQYSYCAVGEISHDYLIDLLSKLLPNPVK